MSLLTLSPSTIGFESNEKTTVVTLTNPKEQAVAFKFKTNAQDKYLLKPIVGKIDPGKKVQVTVQRTKPEEPPSKSDQFLLQSVVLTKPEEETFTPELLKKIEPQRLQKLLVHCQLTQGGSLDPPTKPKGGQDKSLESVQSEQARLRERLILLEQKVQTNSKKGGFSKFQVAMLAFLAMVFGVLAPLIAKHMHAE